MLDRPPREDLDSAGRPRRWLADGSWDRSKDPVILDWDRIRGQIEHEDHLINHRITWLIQINAMLLAAFGAGVYFLRDPKAGALSLDQFSVSLLLAVLICFGAVVSYITLRSVKIANAQIDWLLTWWDSRIAGEAGSHPRLVGIPDAKVDTLFRYAYVVPRAFLVLWVLLAIAHYINFLASAVTQVQRDWIYVAVIAVLFLAVLFQRRPKPGGGPSVRG